MKVIGVGNSWRGDDAVGLVVARRLRSAGLDAVEVEGEPVALLDAWAGEDSVVVVDAVSSGVEPGTIHRLDVGEASLPTELFNASTHAFGLAETIELARALGRLPETLVVYGIEGADFGAGEGLSPAVAQAAEQVGEEVERCTRRP